MAEPIWKDHYSSLGSVASSYFRIKQSGTVIYTGRAFRAASSGTLYVRINDICADFMQQKPTAAYPFSATPVTFPMSFTVEKSSDGLSWSSVETVDFNWDWSYDASFDPSTMGMAFPITGRIDPRQILIQTRYATGSVTGYFTYKSGTIRSVTITLGGVSGTGSAIMQTTLHVGKLNACPNLATYATYGGSPLVSVRIGLTTYQVTDKCPKWVVYYINPFGGFDHLLIEGNAVRRRDVNRETFLAEISTAAAKPQRETWDMQNEVTERLTLNTGLLTDAESERMPYLMEATQVFVADLETDPAYIVPAVIDTASYNVQTYRANGHQMKNYTFDVVLAQKQYRR